MAHNFDQENFDHLFLLLEPTEKSIVGGFRQCRKRLVKYFAWHRVEDPDNLADESITRLLKNVREGLEISGDNPYSYVYGIAKNVYREYLRAQTKQAAILASPEVLEPVTVVHTDECYSHCLAQLSEEKRQLLMDYYLSNTMAEDTARKHNLSLNALRLQIHRTKEWLRRCCEDYRKESSRDRN